MKGLLWPWIVFEWVGQGLQVGLDRHYGFRKETGKAAFGDNFRSSGTHGAAVCKWVGGFASRWVGWQGWSGHQQTFGRPVALPLTFPANTHLET